MEITIELVGLVLGAAGVFASILGAFLSYASRENGKATRSLIRELAVILERMDQRADQRHAEALGAITAARKT